MQRTSHKEHCGPENNVSLGIRGGMVRKRSVPSRKLVLQVNGVDGVTWSL